MQTFSGKTVFKGTAVGPIHVLRRTGRPVKRMKISDPDAEISRLKEAVGRAQKQLSVLYEQALREIGRSGAAIFEAYQVLLDDEDYLEAMYNVIRTEGVNAEYAAAVTGDNFSGIFAAMDDEYMRARATDIRDVSNRLVQLLDDRQAEPEIERPSDGAIILLADELTPGEAVQLNKERLLAIATVHGSTNSHTAILARMRSIPALVGVDLVPEEIADGTPAILDGNTGMLILDPDEEQLARAGRQAEEEREQRALLAELRGKESVTKSGQKIGVYANIGNVTDIGYLLEHDAEGVGLFRSEFLYLGRQDFPGEEEQFQAYRQVLRVMAGKKVIIRTMDIGADKKADYFGLPEEENPALGCRAIRICLLRPEIFRVQLRALLRAAVYGNLSVMYPMITSCEEVRKIFSIVDEVRGELEELGIPYRMPEQGIMIETPAAALISDELAKLVDFFSIGTNDLTQYTLAVDRQNGALEDFYRPHHEAVLRLIAMTVENAHRHGKKVGICGDLAADLTLTETFVNMGIDELSMAPAMVLRVRKRIRELA